MIAAGPTSEAEGCVSQEAEGRMFPMAFGESTATGRRRLERDATIGTRLEPLEPRCMLSASAGVAGAPEGAGTYDNSLYLLGDVAVNLVLLESNGAIDASTEDWTQSEIDKVVDQVNQGLQWWEDMLDLQGVVHDLNFILDTTYALNPFETSYEPIQHDSWRDEQQWIGEFLTHAGHSTSKYSGTHQFNHATREAAGTDWAFTIYIVDSSADSDGKFADGWFGYAYVNGPYITMTYDNSSWGINRMKYVTAHEVGHIFGTLDEYPGAGSYTDTMGYYDVQNTNARDGHPDPGSRVDSIMAEAGKLQNAFRYLTSAESTLAGVGWRDSDGNGVYDVLDLPLTLDATGSYDAEAGTYRVAGDSAVQTLENLGWGSDVTLNTVDLLQYRLNDGEWVDAASFGDARVSFDETLSFGELQAGDYNLEIRTIDADTGVASSVFTDQFTVESVAADPDVVVVAVDPTYTTEAGGRVAVELRLASRPDADVTVHFSVSDSTEASLPTRSITFTAANWDRSRTIYVVGEDDAIRDRTQRYTLDMAVTSLDTDYDGLAVDSIALSNTDDERGREKSERWAKVRNAERYLAFTLLDSHIRNARWVNDLASSFSSLSAPKWVPTDDLAGLIATQTAPFAGHTPMRLASVAVDAAPGLDDADEDPFSAKLPDAWSLLEVAD